MKTLLCASLGMLLATWSAPVLHGSHRLPGTALNSSALSRGTTCDVERLLKPVAPPPGAVVLTLLGEVEDVDALLVPSTIDPGTYSVSVTRKASNLYSVDGYALYVKTQLCLELALSEEATLKVERFQGLTVGELTFRD